MITKTNTLTSFIHRFFVFGVILILLFIINKPVFAQVAQVVQPPKDFVSLIDGIKTLQADFTQVSYQQGIAKKRIAGTLFFQAPDQLKWHQQQPSEQIILINKGITWIYDVDLEQATKRKSYLANTPISWLFGLNHKQKPVFFKQSEQLFWYVLTTDNKLEFNIAFNNQQQLMQIVFNDVLNNQTQIKFSKHQPLRQEEQKIFELNLSNEVDVIDYTQ